MTYDSTNSSTDIIVLYNISTDTYKYTTNTEWNDILVNIFSHLLPLRWK